ncbi:MAG: 50S ribosomal protein L20 [Deltaproteobacteria bacterium RBG_16_71_12]|nr:MAG: 50S ribosomal protein L20 [Deltaproteobacteria bacterium RBG_16_71_12]
MARVKGGPKTRRRHKRVLKMAKGYYGTRRTMFYIANETVERALAFAFRDRKVNKREFRKLWTVRINAAVRPLGMSYSTFIAALKKKNVGLDRRVLAFLAVTDPAAFASVVSFVKA